MTDADPASHGPYNQRGVIRHVVGRGTARGIPELSEVVMNLADGSEIRATLPPPPGERVQAGIVTVDFPLVEFSECPICLDPNPTSREHVPPHSIGGNVLTLTCERCNNEFGSKYEPHLQSWYEVSTGRVRLSGQTVDGRRRAGEFLYRVTDEGEFVLFQNGGADPAVHEILQAGGRMELDMLEPDHGAIAIAAIKSAYLAGCVLMREIPRSRLADSLRSELIAARDRETGRGIELSPALRGIRIARSTAQPVPGEVALVALPAGGAVGAFAISFNRVFAVDWPLDPIAVVASSPEGT